MNCKEIELLLADAVGDELRDADRAAFDTHLAECESCRREYETLRGAMHAMRGVSTPARVSVRREGDRLVISEGRPAADTQRMWRPATVFRYAASVLIAFLAGYLMHAGLMIGDAEKATTPADRMAEAPRKSSSPSLRDALVLAHEHNPNASDFAKLVMAMSERS